MAGDFVSPVGRTRTFPKPDAVVNRLRLGYASCQKWEDGYFTAWHHMQQENLDAVMFLGDYIYEYPGTGSKLRRPTGGWVLTLDDYRQRYALYKGDADLQAMHAACPWLMTWDDHEVQNDYAGMQAGHSGATDPADPGHFLARRAAAYQAYFEHMPIRPSVLTQAMTGLMTGAEMRLYGQMPYGQLATLYLLDARQYKDPQACTKDAALGSGTVNPAQCAQWQDPRRSLLGPAQEHWLYDQFARPQSRPTGWTILGQSTLLGQRDVKVGPGQTFWNDGWDGYPAARRRLTDALQQHAVSNPVVLGGDVHENWVGHVKADYADANSANVGVEFCGTSITSRSGGGAKTADILAENPHFVFADALHRGYGVVEFTPAQLSTTLRVVDDVTRQDTQIDTLARFTVQSGRPLVERV
jgi:alkaline phosphatase D